jgi:two-component system response regulator HydG
MTDTTSALRVLVVEDEPDTALFVRLALSRAGIEVTTATSISQALSTVGAQVFDVVLTDIELPDGDGLLLAEVLGRQSPPVPVIVMTAHSTVDRAVTALRSKVQEFLIKPLATTVLVETVTRVACRARAARRVVLAIGAHPDDIEIGVGATLLAHRAAGDDVRIVTMSQGAVGGVPGQRLGESEAAARLLGARLTVHDLQDTRIVEGNPTIGLIERAVREADPDVVYTHSVNDVHQDHRAVHRATLVACRSVPTVACYQSPSATIDFRPNRFIDVSAHVTAKLKLIGCFRSQQSIRRYLDDDVLLATSRYWARYSDADYVEPLEVIRERASLSTADLHIPADARSLTADRPDNALEAHHVA